MLVVSLYSQVPLPHFGVTHSPPQHWLSAPQALALVLATKVQPSAPQASVVQGLPSSQVTALPEQLPLLQASFSVQASPSLHVDRLALPTQPKPASHTSLVQALPSSQLVG